ncbi:hypothetical protein L1987_74537 [Smallanthus sonchifolius]|uniref:Uncharacterized protein n=1 Tax=Smallanthus sonchifolius TaxID=185202 RepID=A0ACB9A7D8_9ASTR|nr:hypothetical protein L1987_74537 [Smallanthus sonchifolius]
MESLSFIVKQLVCIILALTGIKSFLLAMLQKLLCCIWFVYMVNCFKVNEHSFLFDPSAFIHLLTNSILELNRLCLVGVLVPPTCDFILSRTILIPAEQHLSPSQAFFASTMATVMQKIKDIEDEMAKTQKNKATAHHLGLLKAKLAKLRRELLTPTSKGGGGAGEGFDVTKSGDARVGLVGFPSVGKSTLLNKLTGTFSEIQLLDLPGIIEGAKDGKGRGRQVISTARTCNCILIVLDAIKPITHKRLIEKELEGFGIRLNKEPPNLTFRKKEKGGINFTSTVANTHLDLETVKAICSEYKIHNADVTLRFDATADDLIDVIEGSRIYTPCIYVVNKIDQITLEELEILDKLPHYCPVSAHLEWNLDGLLEMIWEYLNLTRIYTKPKGMNPDYDDPVILSSKKKTVEDFCFRIHKDMLKQFKYALVWGSSAKHKPQRVGKEHELEDDVVQIIKKV